MNYEINDRIIELLHRRLQQEPLTEEEAKELEEWIRQSPDNSQLFYTLTSEELFNEALEEFSQADTERSLQAVRQRIFENKETEELSTIRTNQIPLRRIVAIAATIVLILSFVFYQFFSKPSKSLIAEKQNSPTLFNELIPPGGDKARLTLSNGSIFDLDSSLGKLVIEESAITHGEKLLYDIANAKNTAGVETFNTLSIPLGFKKEIVLPDNSHVWLSSLSAIRFPLQFTGKERRVEITGEAQFEIAKDAAHPFIVTVVSDRGQAKDMEVKVLGTHFNVTAYGNEAISTTLLEGSVQVTHQHQADTLVPGQQAVLAPGEGLKIKDVDISTYAERKEGIFNFKNAPVKTIMNQVQRMYKVKVVYTNEKSLPPGYSITLDQSEGLQATVKALNDADEFTCTLSKDKQTITVAPK